jgi:hypothetical protein
MNYFNPVLTALLFLSTLVTSFTAHACRCDPRGIQELAKDPTRAQVAFIGLAHKSQILVSKKWRSLVDAYEWDRSTSCRPNLIEGQKVLIYGTSVDSIHVCRTLFVEIEQAEDLIKKFDAHFNANE